MVFKTTWTKGRIRIEPCPPEEVGVNRDARTPFIQDCRWVHHRTLKTKAELVEMGFDRDTVMSIPTDDDVPTEEELARRNKADETDYNDLAQHWSMQTVWVTECYVRVDRDDDGIAELLKVTLAAGHHDNASGSIMLDVEEVDMVPFRVLVAGADHAQVPRPVH